MPAQKSQSEGKQRLSESRCSDKCDGSCNILLSRTRFRRAGSYMIVAVPSSTVSGNSVPEFRKYLVPVKEDEPGPASYNVHNFEQIKFVKSPAYTLKGKRKEKEPEKCPAPCSYGLPTTIGPGSKVYKSSPAYSIRGKYTMQNPEKDKRPEPGAYELPDMAVYKKHTPSYSIPKSTIPRPGPIPPYPRIRKPHPNPEPGAYDLPAMDRYMKKFPAFSMPKAGLARSYPLMPRYRICRLYQGSTKVSRNNSCNGSAVKV